MHGVGFFPLLQRKDSEKGQRQVHWIQKPLHLSFPSPPPFAPVKAIAPNLAHFEALPKDLAARAAEHVELRRMVAILDGRAAAGRVALGRLEQLRGLGHGLPLQPKRFTRV